MASAIFIHGAPAGTASSLDVDALGHGEGVARVVEGVVDEHADVVDDGDRGVDEGVPAAEEAQRERPDLDLVAGGARRLDREVGSGGDDAGRSEDAHVGIVVEDAPSCSGVQWSACSWVMTTPTVPADSVIGGRERSGVDVELVAVQLDDDRGMLKLGQSHGASQHPFGAAGNTRRRRFAARAVPALIITV